MNKLLTLLLLLISAHLISQDVTIHYKNVGNDIEIYAHNPHHCVVSVKLELTLKNMRSNMGSETKIFVIPALEKEHYLATLSSINLSKDGSHHTFYESKYGDVTLNEHDTEYPYTLPYEVGNTIMIHQGYNGSYSHNKVNALDFNLKKGSKIYAARGGTIIKVEDRNSKGCASPSCHKFNNMIVIAHDDGSLAVYSHLKRNGSLVREGDIVADGQHIALSGATGYVSGPHLHFMVLLARFGDNKTVKTKFTTKKYGLTSLKERHAYTRPY